MQDQKLNESVTSIVAIAPEVDVRPIERLKAMMIRLSEEKERNDALTFDCSTKKGLTEAKSHVSGLRRLKKPVTNACDEAMEPYKEKIAQIKGCSSGLLSMIEQMIEPHQAAINAEKQKEEDRVSGHRLVIDSMALNYLTLQTLEEVANKREQVASIDTSLLEEFASEAQLNQLASLQRLDEIKARLEREAEQQAELERLRAALAASAPSAPPAAPVTPAAPAAPAAPASFQYRAQAQPIEAPPAVSNEFYEHLKKRLNTFIDTDMDGRILRDPATMIADAIVNGEFSDLLTIKESFSAEEDIAW